MADPKALRVLSLGHCFFCLKKVEKKVGAHQGTYHSLRNLSFWFGGFLRFNILKTHEEVSKNVAKNDLQVELCGRCEEYKKRIDDFVRHLEEAACKVQLTAGVIKEIIQKADDADLTQSIVDCTTDDPEQFTAFSRNVLESARKEIVRKCNLELKRDLFSKKDFTEFRDLMGYDDYVPAKGALKTDGASTVVYIKKEKEDVSDPGLSTAAEEGNCTASSRVELSVPIKLEKNDSANAPISVSIKTEKKETPIFKSISTQTDTSEAENNEEGNPNYFSEPANTEIMENAELPNPLVVSVPMDTDTIMENSDASYVNNVSAPTNTADTVEEEQISTSSNSEDRQLRPRRPKRSTGQYQVSLPKATPNRAVTVSKQSNKNPAMKKPFDSAILRRSSRRNGKAAAGPSVEDLVSPFLPEDIEMVHKIPGPGVTRRYKCTFCAKQFIWACKARMHYEVVHLKIRRYPCEVCNFKFGTVYQLRRHLKKCLERKEKSKDVVEGEDFLCETCLKVFPAKHVLENHKKAVHLKLKNNFACDFCDKRFQQQKNVQEHMDSMHFGILSECVKPCKAKYKHKSGLRKHQKNCQTFQRSKQGFKQVR